MEEGKINNDRDNNNNDNDDDDNNDDNDNTDNDNDNDNNNNNSNDIQFQVAQGSRYSRRKRKPRDYSSNWVTGNAIEELIPDYDDDDRVSLNTIRYEILLDRLLISRLRPVETEKDGNCFFKAIAQIYGEFYQDFILHRYAYMDSYIQNIS